MSPDLQEMAHPEQLEALAYLEGYEGAGFMVANLPAPTVDEVCVIQGPGRGECWACPVRDCVLWADPSNPFSQAAEDAALRAAHKLASRAKVIQPFTDEAQQDIVLVAATLGLAVTDPDVQKRIVVGMAAEAILQDTIRDAVIKRQHQYTDKWAKGLRGRLPTPDDDANYDDLMDRAAADAAAEEYACDPAAVLKQLQYFRGRKIVRRNRE